MTHYTIADLKAANARAGFHFFERATMRFFDSRIVPAGPYCGAGGVYFVTSEQFHGSQGSEARKFTVRQFNPTTGDIDTAGRFNEIRTIEDARVTAKAFARGSDAPETLSTISGDALEGRV